MGFNNPKFDKALWGNQEGIKRGGPGACKQANEPQLELVFNESVRQGELLHCVEPMPATIQALQNAAGALDLDALVDGFVITNAAIASGNGAGPFPKPSAAAVGREDLGLKSCLGRKQRRGQCEEVPMFSLESFVEKYVKSRGPINILSIDVEGFDFDLELELFLIEQNILSLNIMKLEIGESIT